MVDLAAVQVLIVEDDPFQQTVAMQLCRSCGYLVTAVNSGGAALERAENCSTPGPPWDLVLCDVQLEENGFTGVDVLLLLRERYGNDISIVMVSSNDQIEVVEQCKWPKRK